VIVFGVAEAKRLFKINGIGILGEEEVAVPGVTAI
jgi:hypothetical protein